MLLTLKVKLNPTDEQRLKLLKTVETFNAACDDISKEAYESKTYNKIKLQHRLYYRIREQYKLPAQLAIRAIGKVAESYKADPTSARLQPTRRVGLRSEDHEPQGIR